VFCVGHACDKRTRDAFQSSRTLDRSEITFCCTFLFYGQRLAFIIRRIAVGSVGFVFVRISGAENADVVVKVMSMVYRVYSDDIGRRWRSRLELRPGAVIRWHHSARRTTTSSHSPRNSDSAKWTHHVIITVIIHRPRHVHLFFTAFTGARNKSP